MGWALYLGHGSQASGLFPMSASRYTSVCKRNFTAQNYFSQHQHSCPQTRKRLSSAISSVKELLSRRKKSRILHDKVVPSGFVESSDVSPASDLASGEVNSLTGSHHPEVPVVPVLPSRVATGSEVISDLEGDQIEVDEGDNMSLAQRRPRRQNRQLPMRFRDVLPQPPPTVPLGFCQRLPEPVRSIIAPEQPALPFRTPPNVFGLVRQYFSSTLPSHDPEEYVTIADLSFIPGNPDAIEERQALSASASDSQYHPYPNRSSFELGDWYWNQGLQKSQRDYAKLLQILGGSAFNTADLNSTYWKKINTQLGSNEYDEGDGEEWEDEDEDAGWKRTPITIQVPFSRSTDIPGLRPYEAPHLYHCSLVAVLREKLANARDDKLFHYEPYQLRWAPPHLDSKVSIYGDLYTSTAFHEAHSDLQASPREPGCDLPRVIAGLMFWSDATQLTSFGNAKLWPTYMYFGNESKYRHCKPSCNLSNHVAYFETVRVPPEFVIWYAYSRAASFLTHSKILQALKASIASAQLIVIENSFTSSGRFC
jgi:hypothetical protein